MTWTDFISWIVILYLIYYSGNIAYDLFLKKESVKKLKAETLYTFEDDDPVIVDDVEEIKEFRQQKTESFTTDKKILKEQPMTFDDLTGVVDSQEKEEDIGEEIGIGVYDLKRIQTLLKNKVAEKVSKVKFEEAIM